MNNSLDKNKKLSTSKQVLLALKEAKARLEALEKSQTEPIAVVGMACRFPGGANNPDKFWQIISDGVDAITEIPAKRWDVNAYYDPDPNVPEKMYTCYGGFLQDIDQFDPHFFGISPREAVSIDPQHRLLLEVSWEAMENYGHIPQRLQGESTGVFVGITVNDYKEIITQAELDDIAPYGVTGLPLNAAAGRISYTFGFTGPCVAIDTACSSSLVAIHQACQSLRLQECQMALAGGVNLIVSPSSMIGGSKAQMLSPDGRCKTFDETADGIGRAEGCGIVVLKRLSDAIRSQDRILALIRGSAVNQDGPSSGFTVPNSNSQQKLIRQALEMAKVEPSQVSYIEAHGTGTSLGDPIELRSIANVFGKERSREQILKIGSLKTNIGHAESAAGVAALIKVILQLQHKQIPPHLHLNNPTSKFNWKQFPVVVPNQAIPWEVKDGIRIAGVSSFGASGTNAHIVLAEAPQQQTIPTSKTENEDLGRCPFHLLTLSAKTPKALDDLVDSYYNHLENHPELALADICYTANTGRAHFHYRLGILTSDKQELAEKLIGYKSGSEVVGGFQGEQSSRSSAKIAFLFTGQGSQYMNMGRQLYEQAPVFRQALDECDRILSLFLDRSLLSVIYSQATNNLDSSLLDQTAYTQPALFAIEYGLAKLWESWGIQADVVMGHSVGEYVAATVAGVFSLEDGLKLIATRARLMQNLPAGGEMLSVMASAAQVSEAIANYSKQVGIAAINGPESVVISGASEAINQIREDLESKGWKTKQLQVSHAFHSPLMEPMLAEFEKVANRVTYNHPEIPLISNVTGLPADESITTAKYWVNHVRQPVKFAESMGTLEGLGYETFLEIGPKPTLLGMGKQCVAKESLYLPSLRPGVEDWQHMLSSLGQLYVNGYVVNWSGLYRDSNCQKVPLPTYPFQRESYWIELRNGLYKKQLRSRHKNLHPLLGQKLHLAGVEKEQRFESQLSIYEEPYLSDHRVFGQAVLPGTGHLELALAAGSVAFKSDSLILEDVTIFQALIFPEEQPKTVQVVLKPSVTNTYIFEIFSFSSSEQDNKSSILHASGKILQGKTISEASSKDLSTLKEQCDIEVPVDGLYQELDGLGLNYGSKFQAVKKLWKVGENTLGFIELSPEVCAEIEKYKVHPVLFDASLHSSYGVAYGVERENPDDIYLPVKVERLQLYRSCDSKVWSYASNKDTGSQETSNLNVCLFDESGAIVAEIEGIIGKRVTFQAIWNVMQKQLLGDIKNWFYQLEWRPQNLQLQLEQNNKLNQNQELSHWLIFADTTGVGKALATKLTQQGHECTLVYGIQTTQKLETGSYQINPSNLQELEQVYQTIIETSQLPLQKVIHLWSLDIGDPKDLTITSLEESQLWGCGSVVNLIQTLVKNSNSTSPKLWLVTRGSQPVCSNIEELAVAQSPLWGLGRVVSLEHPQLWGGLVDLDPQSPKNEVETLLELLTNSQEEDHIAQREEQTYVPRLVKQISQTFPVVSFSSDATYLITGGAGALGLHTAQWMVGKGVRHLVLVGRSQPSPQAQSTINDLQKQGVEVVMAQADVSHFEEVERVFQQIETSMPPLKGIVHAAGVGTYQLIQQMELSHLESVIRPKVIGAWVLHQMTKELELEFFVNFSSIAAVWGSLGQSHYGAANYFLDSLAYYRQALGLPSLSINWGPWSNGGMADEEQLRELRKRGVQPLSPQEGIAALEQLWMSGNPQTTVAHVDWNLFKPLYEVGKRRLLLEEIKVESQETKFSGVNRKSEIIQKIEIASQNERVSLLKTYLQGHLGKILGLKVSQKPSVEQGLFEMGMDSMMALELRNQINNDLRIDIPITLFMEGVTIAVIANEINQQLTQNNETQYIELEYDTQINPIYVDDSDFIEGEL